MGTALSWTLSALAWTAAGRHIGAIAVSSIRLALAMLYLMAYRQLVHGSALPADAPAQTWAILGLSGLMGFFVSDICLFKAFLLIGPRLSLLVLSLTPPLSAILSWLFLGEGLLARHWLHGYHAGGNRLGRVGAAGDRAVAARPPPAPARTAVGHRGRGGAGRRVRPLAKGHRQLRCPLRHHDPRDRGHGRLPRARHAVGPLAAGLAGRRPPPRCRS